MRRSLLLQGVNGALSKHKRAGLLKLLDDAEVCISALTLIGR